MNKYFIFLIHDKVRLFKENKIKEEIKIFDGDSYTTYKKEKGKIIISNDEIPYVNGNLPSSKPLSTVKYLSYEPLSVLLDIVLDKIEKDENGKKKIYLIADMCAYNIPQIIDMINSIFEDIKGYMGVYSLAEAYYAFSFYLEKMNKKPYIFFNENMSICVERGYAKLLDDTLLCSHLYDEEIENIYYESGFNNFYDNIPTNMIISHIDMGESSYLYENPKDIKVIAKDREFIIKKEVFERIYENVRFKEIIKDFNNYHKPICLSNNKVLLDLLNKNSISYLHYDDYDLELLMDYISIIAEVNNDNKLKFFIKKIKVERQIPNEIPIYFFFRRENLMGKDKIETDILKLLKRKYLNEAN